MKGRRPHVIPLAPLALGIFEISSEEPGLTRDVLPGSLPADESERTGAKPDLEALTALPPDVRAALDRRTAKKWLPGAFEVCELHGDLPLQRLALPNQLLRGDVWPTPTGRETRRYRLRDLQRAVRAARTGNPNAIRKADVMLSHLSPGRYVLEIAAAGRDGRRELPHGFDGV